MARVSVGARIHAGFQNLSLAHERLYGGVGFMIDRPRVVVEATPAPELRCGDDLAATYAERACETLGVPGAAVSVEVQLPRHVGLGSGTQLALAVYAAIATAHGRVSRPRAVAPELGRGGRSGIGVAGFETGGFIVDGGHPTTRFTDAVPERGAWSVPPVIARHPVPDDWRVLVIIPATEKGHSGAAETSRMQTVIKEASPETADRLSAVLTRRLLPAVVTGDRGAFGAALTEFGRLNGTYYADEQAGLYRPPVGELVETLRESDAVVGAGQSSWGPTTYGLIAAERTAAAVEAGEQALRRAGIEGSVLVAAPDNHGARITTE